MNNFTKQKVFQFIIYTLSIYACYIQTGVLHQKILKHKYLNISTQELQRFNHTIFFSICAPFFCSLIGYISIRIYSRYQQKQPIYIPPLKSSACSAVIILNLLTYNQAVMEASFPAVVMVKSCSLLSVILVSVFCSKVKDSNLRLGKQKIMIGIMVTIGIIIFNYFKDIQIQQDNDHPIGLYGAILLFVSLVGDGLLPDLQASIKSQFKPGVLDMYYHVNLYTFLISFSISLVTRSIVKIYQFIINHQEFMYDFFIFSILSALGQLIIYRMIKLFKQHIPSFVIATRKCFTVVINIMYFDHKINIYQIFGMAVVFAAIILQVYQNYKQKQRKQTPSKVTPIQQQKKITSLQIDSGETSNLIKIST